MGVDFRSPAWSYEGSYEVVNAKRAKTKGTAGKRRKRFSRSSSLNSKIEKCLRDN